MIEKGINMKINLILILGSFFLSIYNGAIAQNYGGWKIISSLNIPRANHASTVLPNGNILVTGSTGSPNFLSSCEIYDTLLKTWRYTNPMNIGRSYHKSILLNNGKVLVVGGFMIRSCELFDPITETWVFTDSLINKRSFGFTVSLLNDGNVLVAGGHVYSDDLVYSITLNKCEIYNVETGLWESTDTLKIARLNHTATVLSDGRVLVVGGSGKNGEILNSCEIYNPVTRKWTFVDSLNIARYEHSATLLPNGKVLVAGGRSGPYSWLSRTCEVYNPELNAWTLVDSMIFLRGNHSGILLLDSVILFSGGGYASNTWELYDANNFTPIHWGWLPFEKISHDIIPLPNDRVISIGGWTRSGIAIYPTDTCLIYEYNLTSVKIENNEVPKSFDLFQNYPNPFNAQTIITYQVPEKKFISIKIFNSLGEELLTLDEGIKDPGTYKISFDGSKLSTGVYYCRLISRNYFKTIKMLIIK